ncbi:thioredoxin 1 [Parelusimicrobium proximum]|uniref:thioredoxin family protein n=1 Tax=Parelusimicrobium proximum TaxID=3228953 RepID=UPI003D17F886
MNEHMVNDENFEKEVKGYNGPCFVEFFATWCGHCKRMAPVISELAKEYNGKVKFFLADVDISAKKSDEYNVTGTPTMLFFKDGTQEDYEELVGEQAIETMREYLDALTK